MKVIKCKGSAYEMGIQIGEACGDILKSSLDTTLGILSRGSQNSVDEVIETAGKFLQKSREYDPVLIEQLQGQADAMGIPLKKMFALRCVFELSYYYKQIQGLCTSFTVTGKATKDGKTILAQNIDWLTVYKPYLLHLEYENGTRILALSLSGMVEYSLSSEGFGNCANSLFTKERGNYQFSLPLGCYLPKVMRQASLKDAVDILEKVARGVGYFHLADAKGHLVGIESNFEEAEFIRPVDDVLFHSNCYLTERFKKDDMAHQILPDAFLRKERMTELIQENYGSLDFNIAKKILTDHNKPPYSICRHPATSKNTAWEMKTVASFIMIPEDGVMYVSDGAPCKNDYEEYFV